MKRTIAKAALVIIAIAAWATASFAADKGPTACVKNNAGIVLRVFQAPHPDIRAKGDVLLGQTIKVYTDASLRLYCSNIFGQDETCPCDRKIYVDMYQLKDGQTLELTGTIYWVYTNITDNTCK